MKLNATRKRFQSITLNKQYQVNQDYILQQVGGVSKWTALQSSLTNSSLRPMKNYQLVSD